MEAEQRSDAVFLAVHSPLPLFKRARVDSAEGEIVSEQALLEALADQPADYPIVPILGTPGTGKSHLVRWLRLTMHTSPQTRKVFVPKSQMSLRGIVKKILQYGEGEAFDELRSKVDEAVDALSNEHEARLRLRASLATLIELNGEDAGPEDENPEVRGLRKYLADRNSLPALLLDPWFRESLLSDESPIARIVREKLRGKGDENKSEAFGFVREDFLIRADDMSRAAPAARAVAGDLAADGDLQALAAKMLNEQLERATGEIFGLGGQDLKNMLVTLRKDLAERGEELLLLIEDFSIFQGFQGGLIDAMTLIPSQSEAICPMRVVLAVPTGYWTNHIPDTVKSRTHVVFSLDLPTAPSDEVDIASFVAPYMNGVRLGSSEIESHLREKANIESRCLTCPVVAECHDSFGDVEGVGLFPFNLSALQKASSSQLKGEGAFNARDVLNRVLRPVLHADHSAIDDESFPTEAFAKRFAAGAEDELDIEDEARLERAEDDSELNERRKRLIRFWGTSGAAGNLHPTIHEAFVIPPVEGLRSTETHEPKPKRKPEPEPDAPARPTKPALVDAVDRWIATGEIRMSDRRELRRLVHANVLARLELEDGRYRADWWSDAANGPPAFPEEAVLLGEERPPATKGLVLLRVDGSGEAARALRALAWASAVGNWREVPEGTRLQRLALAQVEVWTRDVHDALFGENGSALDAELNAVVRSLNLGGQMLGLEGAFSSTPTGKLATLLSNPRGDEEAPQELKAWRDDVMTGRTSTAFSRAELQNRLMGLASYSQDGAPKALDVSRILMSLEDEPSVPEIDDQFSERFRRYLGVQKALLERVDNLFTSLASGVPDPADIGGGSIEVATATVDSVLNHAATSGKLPPGIERSLIERAGQHVSQSDIEKVVQIRAAADRWTSLTLAERLQHLDGDWYGSGLRIQSWMAMAEAALDRLQETLGRSDDESGESEAIRAELTSKIGRMTELLSRLVEKRDEG